MEADKCNTSPEAGRETVSNVQSATLGAMATTTSISSHLANSSLSQGSPKSSPLRTKAAVHMALTNHSPLSSASVAAMRLPSHRPLHQTSSAGALLRDVYSSSVMEEESSNKQGKMQRISRKGRGGGEQGSLGNDKQYLKMGIVLGSPPQNSMEPQLPWTLASLRQSAANANGRSLTQAGDDLEGRSTILRSSPPIAVKVEAMDNGGRSPREHRVAQDDLEGVISSPDSGYGNTPEQPLGSVQMGRAQPPGAPPPTRRMRSGAIGSVEEMTSHTSSGAEASNGCQVSVSEGLRGTEVASRDSFSALEFRSDSQYGRRRHREDTQDSAFFMDASSNYEASLHQQQEEDRFPFTNEQNATYPRRRDDGSRHKTYSSPAFSTATTRARSTLPSHVSRPMSALPPSSGTVSNSASTYSGRKKNKYNYHRSLSKSSDYRSKSMTTPRPSLYGASPPREEKDYFQVSDELAQENAHFGMSEALLAVLELYKSNSLEKHRYKDYSSHAPKLPKCSKSQSTSVPNAVTSSVACIPPSSPTWSQASPSQTWSDVTSWASMSSITTTSDDSNDGFSHPTPTSFLALIEATPTDRSAESTAQKLLQHMTHCLTGKAVDTSELALCLPTDFLESLQMDEDLRRSVTTSAAHMRGSREWAPPRKQIIYNIKTPPRALSEEMSVKGYRCTGCGMKVDAAVAKTFRFCNYTGKYFCQSCHTNSTHVIPAYILENWSFRKLPVSNFARDMLCKMENDFVFHVNTSHQIYKKAGSMAQVKEIRGQLVSLRQYLRTCRRAQEINQRFEEAGPWTSSVDAFSLSDFEEIRSGMKIRYLRSLLTEGVAHVKMCPLCQGKGFVCEFCKNSGDIIFPFEISKVSRCKDCQCCFHKDCYSNTRKCPRCTRIIERQRRREKMLLEEETYLESGES